jgi:hypothetical protein
VERVQPDADRPKPGHAPGEHGGERDEESWWEDPTDENFWSYFNDIEDGKDRNFEFDIRFTLPKSAFPELTEVLGPMAPFLVVDL